MSTDRELLEWAAKAYGLALPGSDDTDEIGRQYAPELGLWCRFAWGWEWFRPHLDDGQALRLAVRLRIKFRYNETLGQALAWTGGVEDFEAQANIEDCGRDECAAARKAIVRAAAEIGKAMP